MNENVEVKILPSAFSAEARYLADALPAIDQKARLIIREKLLIPAQREYLLRLA